MTNAERRHINALPKSLKPISAIGYILYTALFALGPIGIIAAVLYAFSAKNLNLRKFARAALVIWVLVIGVAVLLIMTGAVTASSVKAAIEALFAKG